MRSFKNFNLLIVAGYVTFCRLLRKKCLQVFFCLQTIHAKRFLKKFKKIILSELKGMANEKNTIYVGGLADEVTEKLLNDIFIVFGDISEIQIPVDYETQKHRGKLIFLFLIKPFLIYLIPGFAFICYESSEDAAHAVDNMNDSEIS
jgi:RNA recognition motif-containing protein